MKKKRQPAQIKKMILALKHSYRSNQLSDTLARAIFKIMGTTSLVIFLCIVFFLVKNSFNFIFSRDAIKTFFSLSWYPTSFEEVSYGIIPMLMSTIMITFGAILWSAPIGIFTSIFISQYVSKGKRFVIRSLVEVFSSIPSVIIGLIGISIIAPFVHTVFNGTNLFNAYIASFLVGIMALPTVISISLDALEDTPKSVQIASLGLGASKWETIYKVIVPWAKPRLVTAIMLGVGRAVGETMIVLMVAGNSIGFPHGYSSPVRSLTATIAIEMGEVSSGSLHYSALFTLGFILFIFTFIINTMIDRMTRKKAF